MARAFFAYALMAIAVALSAQQPDSSDQHITGCLQAAPAGLQTQGKFVLMNASNSPLGGAAADEVTPPEPARGATESREHRPGESDARQETGGVWYLLQGGSDLESKAGQRVEVTGVIGPEVRVPPTRFATTRPIRTVRVKQVRAIGATCQAPQ